MAGLRLFLREGHWPTLLASFLYFDFCFATWVLNGAMAPFISESLSLTDAQKGFMISVPILAGALIRFPLGVLAQYVGRKNAALVEMGLIVLALGYGSTGVDSYGRVLAMGLLLGIAGASFGVALGLGSGWYPAHLKGLANERLRSGDIIVPTFGTLPWRQQRFTATGWIPSMVASRSCDPSKESTCPFSTSRSAARSPEK